MTSILIKDTTREERQQIVDDAIGNISASCDGCAEGIIEMYQAYIDGEMELREVNAAFNARYVSGEQGAARRSCLGAGGNCAQRNPPRMNGIGGGFFVCFCGTRALSYYFQIRMRQDAPRIFHSG